MSAGYTPGPWQCLPGEADKPYLRVRGMRLGVRYKIANVHSPAYEGAGDRDAGETRANALPVAAAPEQHELLQTFTDWARQVAAREDVPRAIRSAAANLHDDGKRLLAKARPTPGEGA